MSKLQYYTQAQQQLDIEICGNEEALNVLAKIHGKPFVSDEDLDGHTEELLKFGFIDECAGMYTISELGETLINLSVELFVKSEKPELLKRKAGGVKREISDEMTAFKDFSLQCVGDRIKIKEVVVYRSNYFINFETKIKGLGGFEIKNKEEIRVCIRKPTAETIEFFASIGMTYRSAKNQTYFDMYRSNENIEKLINAIVKFFEI